MPTSLLDLGSRPIPHQPIMRLELLHHLVAVVYQRKPSGFSSTVLCAETEAGYLVFVGFVELREFLAEFVFGHVGAVGVEDVTVVPRDQNSALDRYERNRCEVGAPTRPSAFDQGGNCE